MSPISLRGSILACLVILSACAGVPRAEDPTLFSSDVAFNTRLTFEPLAREQAEQYIREEQAYYHTNTDPLKERVAGLERGRAERYKEVYREFPECKHQKHCVGQLSKGSVESFERYNELAKDIHAYDKQLIELNATINEWNYRLTLRERNILNRYVVHQVLQIPNLNSAIQGVLVYSLEGYTSRKQMGQALFRFAGKDLSPQVIGDLDFRMFRLPVDEGALIAAFEIYMNPNPAYPQAPTRFVVAFLVNARRLDFDLYDEPFFKELGTYLADPVQTKIRIGAYCGLYSIANETLAPRFDNMRPKRCAESRSFIQNTTLNRFLETVTPDSILLPLGYFPMTRPGRK